MGHLPFAADARLTKHVCTLSSNALTVDTILNHIFKTHTRNRYGSSTDTDTDRETETGKGAIREEEKGRKKGLHNGCGGETIGARQATEDTQQQRRQKYPNQNSVRRQDEKRRPVLHTRYQIVCLQPSICCAAPPEYRPDGCERGRSGRVARDTRHAGVGSQLSESRNSRLLWTQYARAPRPLRADQHAGRMGVGSSMVVVVLRAHEADTKRRHLTFCQPMFSIRHVCVLRAGPCAPVISVRPASVHPRGRASPRERAPARRGSAA